MEEIGHGRNWTKKNPAQWRDFRMACTTCAIQVL